MVTDDNSYAFTRKLGVKESLMPVLAKRFWTGNKEHIKFGVLETGKVSFMIL